MRPHTAQAWSWPTAWTRPWPAAAACWVTQSASDRWAGRAAGWCPCRLGFPNCAIFQLLLRVQCSGWPVAARFASQPTLAAAPSLPHAQVLANLLSNAVKFTGSGEVVVDAWVEGSPEEGAAQAFAHAAPSDGAERGAVCTSLACPPEAGDTAPPPPAFPRLHLTVRDTGIGIAPSAMEHLFQCFRQVGALGAV